MAGIGLGAKARRNLASRIQPPVLDNGDDLPVDFRRLGLIDNQHAMQAAPLLFPGQRWHRGAVKEGAAVGRREHIVEAALGRHRWLRQAPRAIHGIGNAHALPVDGGRLGELVD